MSDVKDKNTVFVLIHDGDTVFIMIESATGVWQSGHFFIAIVYFADTVVESDHGSLCFDLFVLKIVSTKKVVSLEWVSVL